MHDPSLESAPDAWRAFRAELERVAPSRATVLLEGEPGAGGGEEGTVQGGGEHGDGAGWAGLVDWTLDRGDVAVGSGL